MGLFSSLFGSSSTKTAKPTVWQPQQEYLIGGFDEARDLYNSKKDTPWYQGNLYAGIDDIQKQGANTAGDFLNGLGAQLGDYAANASGLALGAGTDFLSNAGSLFQRFGLDPTQYLQSSAASYANSPYADGLVDAASRDVVRNLTEEQLPGLNADAAGTGNVNSSRTGIAEGIMRRGAADRIGDLGAQIRSGLYEKGLDTARGAWSDMNQSALNANQQLGQLFGTGLQGLGQVSNLARSNFDLSQLAGGVFQGDRQGQLDANYAKWLGEDSRAQEMLNNYWGIVGTPAASGTPQAYQDSSLGILGQIGSTLSLFK